MKRVQSTRGLINPVDFGETHAVRKAALIKDLSKGGEGGEGE